MQARLSIHDRDGVERTLPLRVLLFADLSGRPREVRILEEAPVRPVRSAMQLATLFDQVPPDVARLAEALPADGSVLLDVVDAGPYDFLVELAEVPEIEKAGPFQNAAHARGFGNGGPYGVVVLRHRYGLMNPIERALWAQLAELAASMQCAMLVDAAPTYPKDASALEELAASPFAHALFRREGSYTPDVSQAVAAATTLIESYRRHGERLAEVRELAAIRSVDGTPLPTTLLKQALIRVVIATADERRWSGRAMEGVERVLLDGADPPCTLARLDPEGGPPAPGARFVLRVVTSASWTGEPLSLEVRGRFER